MTGEGRGEPNSDDGTDGTESLELCILCAMNDSMRRNRPKKLAFHDTRKKVKHSLNDLLTFCSLGLSSHCVAGREFVFYT